jgi:broad specificity phosphatase PhoE
VTGTLVLVRHGESTWIAEGRFQGRQNPPLSELGLRQAGLVGGRLAERGEQTPLPIPPGPPIGIWHSPLSRAATTAKAIADAQPAVVSLHRTEGLTEIAQGDWEGQPHSIVSTKWAAELAAWRRSPTTDHAPGGESLAEAAARVATAIYEVGVTLGTTFEGVYDPVPGYQVATYPAAADRPTEPWAVLVAHDGIFRLALMLLLDLPLERFWSFPFNLCAITVVALHEGLPALRAHNLSEHLTPIAIESRAAAEARGDRRGAL